MRVERETILCLTLELRFAYRPASKVVKKLTKNSSQCTPSAAYRKAYKKVFSVF